MHPKDPTIAVKIYGIFDVEKNQLIKVSLDAEEISMEYMLVLNKRNLRECLISAAIVLDLS